MYSGYWKQISSDAFTSSGGLWPTCGNFHWCPCPYVIVCRQRCLQPCLLLAQTCWVDREVICAFSQGTEWSASNVSCGASTLGTPEGHLSHWRSCLMYPCTIPGTEGGSCERSSLRTYVSTCMIWEGCGRTQRAPRPSPLAHGTTYMFSHKSLPDGWVSLRTQTVETGIVTNVVNLALGLALGTLRSATGSGLAGKLRCRGRSASWSCPCA